MQSIAIVPLTMHKNMPDVFNESGVQIVVPAYEGDPLVPKVVPPSGWYAAPAVETAPPPAAAPSTVR